MTSGDLVGYGESAPLTHRFTPARPSRRLRQCSMSGSYRRLWQGVHLHRRAEQRSGRRYKGNNFAKAGLENAYWDLVAKKNNLRLVDAIKIKLAQMGVDQKHLEYKEYIESGVSVGIPGTGVSTL